MSHKFFTLEEANALLPYISRDIKALQLARHTLDLKLNHLLRRKERRHKINKPVYPYTFFHMECEIEFLQMEAQVYLRSLKSKAVEIKDLNLGLIDFPAKIDGEEVYLCWKLGEEEISHYHRMDEGFVCRKPIPKYN